MSEKIKFKCVVCKKTMRNYQPGEKLCHRICWMKLRNKDERHLDFLFCKDKKKEQMKKTIIISPEQDSDLSST